MDIKAVVGRNVKQCRDAALLRLPRRTYVSGFGRWIIKRTILIVSKLASPLGIMAFKILELNI